MAREFYFEPGTIAVMDCGYVDYECYQRMSDESVFFVTCMRHDAHYRVIEEGEPLPHGTSGKRSDRIGQPPSPTIGAVSTNRGFEWKTSKRSEVWLDHHCLHLPGTLANRLPTREAMRTRG